MQWEFTPEQVVKGEIGYGLAEFRRDLFEEVRANLGADNPASLPDEDAGIWDKTQPAVKGVPGPSQAVFKDPPKNAKAIKIKVSHYKNLEHLCS